MLYCKFNLKISWGEILKFYLFHNGGHILKIKAVTMLILVDQVCGSGSASDCNSNYSYIMCSTGIYTRPLDSQYSCQKSYGKSSVDNAKTSMPTHNILWKVRLFGKRNFLSNNNISFFYLVTEKNQVSFISTAIWVPFIKYVFVSMFYE